MQHRVAGGRDLLLQSFEQMGAPLRQVRDARGHAVGVQAQAQHVDGRLQQFGRGAFHQERHQRVVRDQVPVTVHGQRRKGLVPLQHQVDGAARGGHGRVVERALPVHRREARRHQQRIALAQRHFQPFGQPQHHLAAGGCAAGFHIAQVAGRDLGLLRQVELAQAAVGAPVPQVDTERVTCAGSVGLGRMGAEGVHGAAFWRGGGAAP
ncbi:MAG: hypothetical protein BGP22_15245 [Variovorax sp. 67-131]|nr:MAG: hypothetical protein BGP22_15245 [Variovorax sp. 67-131]